MSGRIFAMGGGGFSGRPADPALDRYVLDSAGVQRPRICLLPTAGGDAQEQIQRFYRTFFDLPCVPVHLSLFRLGMAPVDPRVLLMSQDVIYVGGGSMLNLLAIWRAHGIDEILRDAWEAGILLCGISAGSMCWFEHGLTKSLGPPREARGLGFLPGSNAVHYRNEPGRRASFLEAVRTAAVPPGYGVDDGAGLLFEGTELIEAVSAREGAGVQRVEKSANGVSEAALAVTHLEAPAWDDRTPLAIREFRELHARR